MERSIRIAALAALVLTAGCGGGDEGTGGLTAEENRKLNEIGERLDTTDTSPDSMTVADESDPGNGAEAAAEDAAANGQ